MNDLRKMALDSLWRTACTPKTGIDIHRLSTFITYLEQHLSPAVSAEAVALLHAAFDPEYARQRDHPD
jgi:hypothetical protein